MIDDQSLLVLPLMHHLVQEGVERFAPAVPSDVPPANDYFGLASKDGGAIVAESAFHSTRDTDGNGFKGPTKSLAIVRVVPARELSNHREVGWIGALRRPLTARRAGRPRHGKLEDRSSRFIPSHTSPGVNESNNRSPHLLVGAEEAVVDAKLTAAVADDYGPVHCESHPILPAEPKALEPRPQLLRVFRAALIQLKRELIEATWPPHTPTA